MYNSILGFVFILISFLGSDNKYFKYADIIGSVVIAFMSIKVGIEILLKNVSSILGEVETDNSKINSVKEIIKSNLYKIRRVTLIKYGHYYDDLVKYISNKRVTINKVNRILINIFVGLTKEEASNKELSYIKILGLSKNGKKYYSKIKKDINIKVCNKFEKEVMNTELKASYLYSIITNDKSIFNSEIKEHTKVI